MKTPTTFIATIFAVFIIALSSCTQISTLPVGIPDCQFLITDLEQRIVSHKVRNRETQLLNRLPYLRTTRFLDSFTEQTLTDAQQTQWLTMMAELGSKAWQQENKNLPQPLAKSVMMELQTCTNNAISQEPTRAEILRQLQQGPEVKDSYIEFRKWLGLYALLAPFYRARVVAWQQLEATETQQQTLFPLSFPSATTNFVADTAGSSLADSEISTLFSRSMQRNALKIPLLSEPEQQQLFARHAPQLIIEFANENDLIGSPSWKQGALFIDHEKPAAYQQISYTRMGDRIFLQLNYVFWFKKRPRSGALDLYSGNVDSIIWRVTLDETGKVILFDSIHSCGCYHKFYLPPSGLVIRDNFTSNEPPLIFPIPHYLSDQAVQIYITSKNHYIRGIFQGLNTAGPTQMYEQKNYRELYNLPWRDKSRSMFDHQGLVPGSERLERVLLWPTGILSVGAMRQLGQHATGFLEPQHFDDVYLLEKYFFTP